ncbi:hypothetical protein [Falsiroseomonas tokyonensis]|uniref:Uncharacterized protein n=1 Tax=Falsiroseomonas tokyonensis TaxID=430521 RepID=A0ABV7C008_9PROT|nr:hypothetical protein [Falsiroseomonas tokyonensis]MBU8539790.1 hypothetical protein [Falsiroseomonas tokyonensis]
MRETMTDHRPVTEIDNQTRAAWLGAAEAARQQALLRVAPPVGTDEIRTDRRRGDRRQA